MDHRLAVAVRLLLVRQLEDRAVAVRVAAVLRRPVEVTMGVRDDPGARKRAVRATHERIQDALGVRRSARRQFEDRSAPVVGAAVEARARAAFGGRTVERAGGVDGQFAIRGRTVWAARELVDQALRVRARALRGQLEHATAAHSVEAAEQVAGGRRETAVERGAVQVAVRVGDELRDRVVRAGRRAE
jgi:phage gpG-like protein